MKIDGVPDGFEIRSVYDAQGLADACVSGQKLQQGERVVCAIISPVSQSVAASRLEDLLSVSLLQDKIDDLENVVQMLRVLKKQMAQK